MKKLLLMTAITLGLFSGVQAKKVLFQVDMTGQTIHASGVHIAGSFQAAAGAPGDWSPSATAMSNGGSGNIYSVMVDIPAGRTYEFKFINGNDWPQAENVPALNQVGHTNNAGSNGNRWWHIDSVANDTSRLPAIKFGMEAPAGKVAVRFAVDMQKETAVSANGVHIAGAFQGWPAPNTSMVNLFTANKVYEYIAYLDTISYVFKYINGNAWGSDESIPSACAVNNNRSVHPHMNEALPKVCFASCIACPSAPIPRYMASFIVDMTNSDCEVFDSVTVAGGRPEITNWGNGIKLMNIPNSKYYAGVIEMDSGEVQFKFRYHKNNVTSWEGGDNRVWMLSKHDTTDVTCFGLRVPCTPKPAASSVTFKVDLTNETPDAQGRIYVEGTFQIPNWKEGAVRMMPVTGQPGIYSVTINNVCPGKFEYKFMNGDSSLGASEETFPDSTMRACLEPSGVGGFNRHYTRTSTNPVTLFYVFNTCTAGSSVGVTELNALAANVKMFPNPAHTYTTIQFNDKAASHEVSVMTLAGQVVKTFSTGDNSVRIENLNSGMYLVNIHNSHAETKVLKLIIQ